jgi:dCTP deaminase
MFWSTEKLKERLVAETLFEPCDLSSVKNGAFELRLGSEAFVTTDGTSTKSEIAAGKQLVIPPGQFGLLVTEERISIPADAIGFISIKAGIKFRGLVNVSGFHVDPGFSGKLKFAVYNAGSQSIILDRGQRVFLIWFSSLDRTTADLYKGNHQNQLVITSEDITGIQGEIASPATLKKGFDTLRTDYAKAFAELKSEYTNKISVLERDVSHWKTITVTALISLAVGIALLFVRAIVDNAPRVPAAVPSASAPSGNNK